MKNKLPIEFKKKWVAALRSGEYEQGKESLYNSKKNSYYCLGVACRVSGISKEKLDNKGFIQDIENIKIKVPVVLVDFDNDNPISNKLVTLNDHDNYSFDEIADYIKENL